MGYKEAVARNPRLLFWGKVFMEAKGLAIIEVLFFMHRGLTIDEVYYLSIAWSIATLITEVPSGYLADRIGRKRTIMIGMVLYLTACIIRIYAFGFVHFAVVFVLFSIGFSCMSGTEEALLFDSLKEVKKEHEMQQLNARLHSGKFVARIFIAIAAIFLVTELKESQYTLLAQIDVAMMLIAFIIISFIKEPNIKSKELGKDKEIFLQSLKTIITQPWLVRATMSKLLLFFAGFFIFRTYQPLLHINGATVTIIGCFYLVTRGGIFLTHWYSGKMVNLLGTARWINGSAVIAIAGLVVTLVSQNIWLWIVPFAIASVMIDVRDPLFSKAINDRIDSRNRATTISILNMAKAVFDIPLLLLVGWLTTYSISYAIIAAIAACGIAVIYFWSKEKEFEGIKL